MPAPHFPDMTPQVPRAQHDDASRFSADVYRASNLDLRGMSDAQLRAHFAASRHEPRLFGPTPDTVNFMSMRWLRGRGVEVGAGGSPTPLYGPTTTLQADCDPGLAFGGRTLDMPGSIDDPRFAQQAEGRFDFSIASHVLEHADSFIRSVDNLVTLVRPGGVAYIVLPDIAFLDDSRWLPAHDFEHHAREYEDPLAFAALHDQHYLDAAGAGIDHQNTHAALPPEYREAVRRGVIPAAQRFMHHKHNYRLAGWTALMLKARDFLGARFDVEDIRYGHERMDCHFVLRRLR